MGIGVVSTERDVEHASVQSGQQQQPNLPSSTWVSTIPRSTTVGLAASLSAEITRIRHIHWAETEHYPPMYAVDLFSSARHHCAPQLGVCLMDKASPAHPAL